MGVVIVGGTISLVLTLLLFPHLFYVVTNKKTHPEFEHIEEYEKAAQ
jgi:hypothetical protein